MAEKKYAYNVSELEEKMYDTVGHAVKMKLKDGKTVEGKSVYFETSTEAEMDYPVVYVFAKDDECANGYSEDQIESIEIVD